MRRERGMPNHRKVTMSTTSRILRDARPRATPLAVCHCGGRVSAWRMRSTARAAVPEPLGRLGEGSFTVPEASARGPSGSDREGVPEQGPEVRRPQPVLQRTINKVATPLTDRAVEQAAGVPEGDVLRDRQRGQAHGRVGVDGSTRGARLRRAETTAQAIQSPRSARSCTAWARRSRS